MTAFCHIFADVICIFHAVPNILQQFYFSNSLHLGYVCSNYHVDTEIQMIIFTKAADFYYRPRYKTDYNKFDKRRHPVYN